jgi:hypothetical protein
MKKQYEFRISKLYKNIDASKIYHFYSTMSTTSTPKFFTNASPLLSRGSKTIKELPQQHPLTREALTTIDLLLSLMTDDVSTIKQQY